MSNTNDFIIEDGLLIIYEGPGGDAIIPAGVTRIDEEAFAWCDNLASVHIPNSVREIGPAAFCDCTGLTTVNIPNGVTNIGERAFNGCPNLTIHAPVGSYAETYAKENNIPFVAE